MMAVSPAYGRCMLIALALLGSVARAAGEGECPPGEQALKTRLATLLTLSANF